MEGIHARACRCRKAEMQAGFPVGRNGAIAKGYRVPAIPQRALPFAETGVPERRQGGLTSAGKALLYPGAFLLGNSGTCFECGHDHGVGDRCIAFHFDDAFFEEIASATAGTSRFRFAAAMLPASRTLALPVLKSALSASGHGLVAADELAIRLAEAVIGASSDTALALGAGATADRQCAPLYRGTQPRAAESAPPRRRGVHEHVSFSAHVPADGRNDAAPIPARRPDTPSRDSPMYDPGTDHPNRV